MVKLRRKWPEVDDLVIGTVGTITPHGVYVKLDEYEDREGLIHISEISSSWVRNIRTFVKEGQKTVLKVLRVNQSKEQVDLSLRRVNQQQRRNKLIQWKREQKAEKLLELAAKELGTTLNIAYRDAGWKLEDTYGDIMTGLERSGIEGPIVLKEAGLEPKWIKVLHEMAKAHTTITQVTIAGTFDLKSLKSNGINIIKDSLQAGLNQIKDDEGVSGDVWSDGAAKYHLQIKANDYKSAEESMKSVVETTIEKMRQQGGEATFTRIEAK